MFSPDWNAAHVLPMWVAGGVLIKLAQAFPACRYFGYDVYGPAVEEATARAKAADVQDRVTFQQVDVSNGLPGQFDVITTFDVIHDAVDPFGILKVLRRALAPDGVYVCLDINCSDKLEENIGPLGTLFHGFRVLYCIILHDNVTCLGRCGAGHVRFSSQKSPRNVAQKLGFHRVRKVPLENPFNNLYEITP